MEQLYINDAPDAVKAAFYHVRAFFPDVTKVTYDENCRWCYEGDNDYFPAFSSGTVDTGVLELGADEQYNINVPVLYQMYPEKILAKSEIPGKPTVTLTEVGPDTYDVNCGNACVSYGFIEPAIREFAFQVQSYQA